MARIEIDGLIENIDYFLDERGKAIIPASKMALYDGAGEMIEGLKAEIRALPEDYGYVKKGGQPLQGLTSKQKQGLLDGCGISKMRRAGSAIEVTIGFAGYNSYKTKKYPKGQPNALIRRSLVKGTPYLKKNRFVNNAYKKNSQKVIKIICERFGAYAAQIINDKR